MTTRMNHFWQRQRWNRDPDFSRDDEVESLEQAAGRLTRSLPEARLDGRLPAGTPAAASASPDLGALATVAAADGLASGKLGPSLREPALDGRLTMLETLIAPAERKTHSRSEAALAAQASLLIDTMAICFAPGSIESLPPSRFPQPITPLFGAEPC